MQRWPRLRPNAGGNGSAGMWVTYTKTLGDAMLDDHTKDFYTTARNSPIQLDSKIFPFKLIARNEALWTTMKDDLFARRS